MKVKDLVNYLRMIGGEKDIDLVVNVDNPEDENEDIACDNMEVWDNGSESVVFFVSRRV